MNHFNPHNKIKVNSKLFPLFNSKDLKIQTVVIHRYVKFKPISPIGIRLEAASMLLVKLS